ncbi:MAG: tetratricopeptide repeat protein [Pseudomonadota bacterium]|nr:tetratricopeptide repeat protein [Pseudomonadota bacterium]
MSFDSQPMKSRPSLLAAALFALAGCSQMPSTPQDPAPAAPPRDLPPIEYDGETLGDLLVAESAAQRQSLRVTMAYYARAAETTHDPEIIAQATKLATYLEEHEQARHLAGLWLERQPDNADALRLAALADIQLERPEQATESIDRLLAVHGSEALIPLVAEARGLDEGANQRLLNALSGLAERYPEQAPLWYARALDRRQQSDLDGALEAVDTALDQDPDHGEAALLRTQILFEQGRRDKALSELSDIVDEAPDARRPRVAYVRLLLAAGRYDRASEQLTILAEQNPRDLDLQYSLALLALESGAMDSAEAILQRLLRQGYRPNEMRLHLGQAAEQRGDSNGAIDYYLKVKGGESLQAQVQAARLMYSEGRGDQAHALITSLTHQYPEQATLLWISEADMRAANGDPESALALLDRALETAPDNPELLYARAMTAGGLGNYEAMEADLRRVLEQQPDDPAALNALGYTWADQGVHLEQARDMIRRALEQQPNDPAILDSMGWVLYRLGRPEDALPFLRRAYAQFPDPEVSAHLGEVLWVLGEEDDARRVWATALEQSPEAEPIMETLQRLEVTL